MYHTLRGAQMFFDLSHDVRDFRRRLLLSYKIVNILFYFIYFVHKSVQFVNVVSMQRAQPGRDIIFENFLKIIFEKKAKTKKEQNNWSICRKYYFTARRFERLNAYLFVEKRII